MTTEDDDRRSAPRAPIEDTLFIESVSSSQISPMEPTIANTINASHNGLQVELDFPVLENAEIALWINSSGAHSRTLISGMVRWVKPAQEGKFLVGIELDQESTPAIKQWLDNIH